MNEFNILIGNVSESDKKLFFGEAPWVTEKRGTPEVMEEFLIFPMKTKFSTLLRDLGIFKSASEALRMGWKDIPFGFTDVTIGKFKKRVTILKLDK